MPSSDSRGLSAALTSEEKRRAALGLGPMPRKAVPDPRLSTALATIRGGRVGGLAAEVRDQAQARAAAAIAAPVRPRMVLAIDATASRQHAWEVARSVTDSLFTAVPGGLEVALAAHGGGRMTLFTPFHADANALRDDAAAVTCRAGHTKLLDILERTRGFAGVKIVVYIGDNFEEDGMAGIALADLLRARGTRLVVLHDAASARPGARESFETLTNRTGGCVLPFDAAAPQRLRDLLASLAAYAAGGRDLLRRRSALSASSRLLLEYLPH